MSGGGKPALPPSLGARDAARRGDFDSLIELVSSGDPQARLSAAGQLRKLQDPRAVPVLVRCLQSPESTGKVSVLKALRDIGGCQSADAVFDLAGNASEPFQVRATAAQTLVSFGDRRGITRLAALFGETTAKHHSSFRKWGLRLLVESNGTEALPALRAVRSEVGVMERRRIDRAVQTLERLDQPQAPER